MSKTSCPVCNNSAQQEHTADHGSQVHWNCDQCGNFRTYNSAAGSLSRMDTQQRAKMSGWIFERNRDGEAPVITRDIVEEVTARRLPTVGERAERLLFEALREQTRLGALFNFYEARFIAATYSQDADEVQFLVQHLSNLGRVREISSKGECEILPKGYIAADALAFREGPSDKGFVAMSFGDELNNVYMKGFAIGIEKAGYNPVRVDRIEHTNRIDDEIIAQIRNSYFVVADFTEHRGGVYFEAGFALGLNLPVIWTCRKDHMKNLHFDIRQYNMIDWDSEKDLAVRLQRRIEARIGKGSRSY